MEKNEMTFKSVNNHAPYIVDEDSKCLRQLRLTKIVYDLEKGKTELTWIEAETGKYVHGDLSDKQVYASEEQFKKGKLLDVNDLYLSKCFLDIINDATPGRMVHMERIRPFSWVYENGVATKFYYDERISRVTKTFGHDGRGMAKIETDVELPEMYSSVEEVYQFNGYEIVNNDGSKTFHEGLCGRLELTKGQDALVDRLQEIIDECKKEKIAICIDLSDYRFVAFNVANIDSYGYDPSFDEDTEVAQYLNLRRARTINGIGDVNTDDYSQFIVKKDSLKTSRQ